MVWSVELVFTCGLVMSNAWDKQTRRRSFNAYKKFKKETSYKANELYYYGRGTRLVKENVKLKERLQAQDEKLHCNKRQLTNDLIELEMKDHDIAHDMDWLSIHQLLKLFHWFPHRQKELRTYRFQFTLERKREKKNRAPTVFKLQ
ncbi:hypothetical protein G4B88_027635 [Cannabis sativa]|uniref:Uncharacterized protein n=1 Tax=Cannabis sativa TaxID=3483 RepID=A0A7J6GC91_CANSA|nr:hypothetical protein G4B88_027635 [Cannabis sativa]